MRTVSKGFSGIESREVSLNGNMYDFSLDYIFVVKSGMLNVYKYLMAKNNIK